MHRQMNGNIYVALFMLEVENIISRLLVESGFINMIGQNPF